MRLACSIMSGGEDRDGRDSGVGRVGVAGEHIAGTLVMSLEEISAGAITRSLKMDSSLADVVKSSFDDDESRAIGCSHVVCE